MTTIYQGDIGNHILQGDESWNASQNSIKLNVQGGEDMSTLNKITGLVVGQFGTAIPITIVDDEGTGIDLSTYTTVTVRAMSPDARTILIFSSPGGDSSGNFSITPSSGNTFDRDGTWLAQANFVATGILALSVIFEMEIERKI
jgi:hypothetical protein